MRRIDLTFEVIKLDKFSEVNEEQPWKSEFIFCTFEVSKLDKSSKDNDKQL